MRPSWLLDGSDLPTIFRIESTGELRLDVCRASVNEYVWSALHCVREMAGQSQPDAAEWMAMRHHVLRYDLINRQSKIGCCRVS